MLEFMYFSVYIDVCSGILMNIVYQSGEKIMSNKKHMFYFACM